jgi:hypothetical protein
MVLKRSCPAVSQICILTALLSNSRVLRCLSALLEFEVDSDCGEVALLEGVICKSTQQGGLSDRAVANQHDFIVEVLSHRVVIGSRFAIK